MNEDRETETDIVTGKTGKVAYSLKQKTRPLSGRLGVQRGGDGGMDGRRTHQLYRLYSTAPAAAAAAWRGVAWHRRY